MLDKFESKPQSKDLGQNCKAMAKYRILIVDDHPFVCKAYSILLNELEKKNDDFSIEHVDICLTYDDALQNVKQSIHESKVYDIVLLDIRLKDNVQLNKYDGEHLGLEIRKLSPDTKLLVISAISEPYRYHSILDSIVPEGFLVKSEMDNIIFESARTADLLQTASELQLI